MLKNVAGQYIAFNAVSSTDGSAVTTGTPVVYATIDNGTQSAVTNTPVHKGNGDWTLALTQAETNGDHISFTMVLTGAINSKVQVYPYVENDFKADLTSLNDITAADVYTEFTSGTNEDAFKADVSGLATSAEIAALNNFDPDTDQVIVATNNDKIGYELSTAGLGSVTDFVWDVALNSVNVPGSTGQALRQLKEGIVSGEASVTGTPTNTTFQCTLPSGVNDFYNDMIIKFTSGSLEGQSRIIADYVGGSTKSVTVDEPLTSIPAVGDDFIVLSAHSHPVSQIAEAVWSEPQSGYTTVGTFGYNLDDQISNVGGGSGGGSTAAEIYTYFTDGSREDAFKADVSALATSAEVTALNDITAADVYAEFTNLSNADAFKADVSGLATSAEIAALNDFDPATDQVTVATNNDKSGYQLDSSTLSSIADAVWDELQSGHTTVGSFGYYLDSQVSAAGGGAAPTEADIYTYFTSSSREDVFKSDVSGLATSAEIAALNDITAADVYTEFTTASNADAFKADVSGLASQASVDGLNDITAAAVYAEFTSASNADAFKADVSGLASQASVDGLNDITAAAVYAEFTSASNADAFKADVTGLALETSVQSVLANSNNLATTLQSDGLGGYQFTSTALELAPTGSGGGGGSTAAEIYTYFTDGSRADAFKADVASIETVTDKLDTMIQVDGSNWQWTADSLELAPASGGGGTSDWTEIEKEEIRYRLGIDGNTNVPSTNNPDLARNTTAQTVIDALTIEIDGLNDFNPATDTVARVTLVDTTTVNTDMVDVSALALEASVQGLNDVSAADVYTEFTNLSNADAFKADVTALATTAQIDALNDFNPATDTVARVTLVDTTTVNSDMVDVTGMALEASVQALNDPSAADIYNYFTGLTRANLFKADVTALATSADISALNDFNPATDTVARVTLVDTTTTNTDMVDISGLATSAEIASLNDLSLSEIVNGVWDENQSLHNTIGTFGAYLDGQVTSAGGDDAATIYAFFTAGSNEDAFKANVSGLATSAEVAALPTAGDVYTQFVAGTNADAFKADVSALALQATLTAQNDLSSSQVASAVWDSLQSNHTTFGSFGFYLDSTVSTAGGGSMTPSDIYAYFTDVSREDAFKADVSALALEASVTALPSAADTYSYFAAGNRPDPFKADVTGLATESQIAGLATSAQIEALNDFDPDTDVVAHVTLVDTTTSLTNQSTDNGLAPRAY